MRPPVRPMLARLVRELPRGGFLYEPKWDGFRCLAFREGEEVELQSRHGRPLGRYFPEIVEALLALPAAEVVLDGELVPLDGDFAALMGRLHPAASRVERLRREAPVTFVAFDLLALGREELAERPFAERRGRLERLLADSPTAVRLTPATRDEATAERWLAEHEGVVAKHEALAYAPGKRAMLKVKRERTADCVVAGFRPYVDRPVPASLLLGLHDGEDLVHVGVASSFTERRRAELLEELRPLAVPLDEHPWRNGYLLGGGTTGRLPGSAGRWTPDMPLDWQPLAPERVAEVAYDRLDGRRFRHPARFVRWRPERDPGSCTFEQLA